MLYRRHPLYAALFLTSPARATKRPPNREPGLDFARLSPINYLREDHEETTLIPTSQPLSASLEAVVLRLMAVVLVVAVVAVVVVYSGGVWVAIFLAWTPAFTMAPTTSMAR